MSEIKAGDIVQLKSGGPRMTVSSIGEDMGGTPTAYCAWFDGPKKQQAAFPLLSLKVLDA
jgi:uncharacterized protein YodC (DUF2158 family)